MKLFENIIDNQFKLIKEIDFNRSIKIIEPDWKIQLNRLKQGKPFYEGTMKEL